VTFNQDFKVTTFSTLNISETTQDRAIVTIERQYRKSYALYRVVTFPMTLTDP